MRERPILFSGPMVRAILDGRKTQTRRVVKKVGRDNCLPDRRVKSAFGAVVHVKDAAELCPYGQPGDRLWVRETWQRKSGGEQMARYRADFDGMLDRALRESFTWKPSIHMPRWASRISLEITAVRAERLQACSEDDAVAEGQARHNKPPESVSTVEMFAGSWDKLNAERGFGWAENPWVWVLTFKVIA